MIRRMMTLCTTGRDRAGATTFAAAGFGETPTIPATVKNAADPLTQARSRICPRDQRALFAGRDSVIASPGGGPAGVVVSPVIDIGAGPGGTCIADRHRDRRRRG